VLVHGAFADASSWSGVIERLQAAGMQVTAAANPLRGISTDSAYTASFLEKEKRCHRSFPVASEAGAATMFRPNASRRAST
jgi:hypothetical protein